MIGFQPAMYWWPLPGVPKDVPVGTHPGAFASKRKFDIHTGVDIYCKSGQIVTACTNGLVIGVEPFTGSHADSPWWNNTWAVFVRDPSGTVFCYGEVHPLVMVNQEIEAGQPLGVIIPVLKIDKGKPMSMLHFEMYTPNFKEAVWWKHDENKPDTLIDPTNTLLDSFDNVGTEETAVLMMSENVYKKLKEILSMVIRGT